MEYELGGLLLVLDVLDLFDLILGECGGMLGGGGVENGVGVVTRLRLFLLGDGDGDG